MKMARRGSVLRFATIIVFLVPLLATGPSHAGTTEPQCTTIASGKITQVREISPGGRWVYGISARSTGICVAPIEEIYVSVEWDYRFFEGVNQSACARCYHYWVNSYGSFTSTEQFPCATVIAKAIFIGGQGDDKDSTTVCYTG
jgi:hypothetical protein